jgi:hypothetical protein
MAKPLMCEVIAERKAINKDRTTNHETKRGLSSQGKSTVRISDFSSEDLVKISTCCDVACLGETDHFRIYKDR